MKAHVDALSMNYPTYNKKLINLYQKIDNCPLCEKSHNSLQHILGVGDTQSPKFMLLLINPTYRNISSQSAYKGWRFPFIGVKSLWDVFLKSSLIAKETHDFIDQGKWGRETQRKILQDIKERKIYLTNLSKCTRSDASYPNRETVDYHLRILKEELKILKPQIIISLGLFPFEKLIGQKIKLLRYYKDVVAGNIKTFSLVKHSNLKSKVVPCYFPTGRGNPKRAAKMLQIFIHSRSSLFC